MELKYPKEVTIGYRTFTVEYLKDLAGGAFSFEDNSIAIGLQHKKLDPSCTYNIICHEVLEICMALSKVRYVDNSTEDNYKFFLDHKEFEMVTAMFSKAIQQFIK